MSVKCLIMKDCISLWMESKCIDLMHPPGDVDYVVVEVLPELIHDLVLFIEG